jgi:hypothetical protein
VLTSISFSLQPLVRCGMMHFTFPTLDTLDMFGLTQHCMDVVIGIEILGSCFGARGQTAVTELWQGFMACYCAR